MKVNFIIFFLITILNIFSNLSAQIETGNFELDGIERDYKVFLPKNFEPNMPLVLTLHGAFENGNSIMAYTRMNEVADTAGFIAVYPNSIPPRWADGTPDINADDVGFISALIDTLNALYSIDLSRIYSCGYSSGGMMSNRLAIEFGHRFASVANVAGGINTNTAANYNPLRAFPVLTSHGTLDNIVPYDGRSGLLSVEDGLNFWIQQNSCALQADTVLLPNLNLNDSSTVEKISYTDCSDNAQLLFYKIIGGGHHWPGGISDWTGGGNLNKDIKISEEIWNFFKRFKNPLIKMAFGKSMEIYPQFIELSGGIVNINAQLHNPENHDLKVYTLINGDESVVQDSIELFDDGLHNDGKASDNNWGEKKFLSSLEKDYYKVALYTNDLNTGTTHLYRFESRFTTLGPIICKDYFVERHSDSLYSLKLTLENKDSTLPISNVKATISTTDNRIKEILSHINPQFYPNIEPGQSVQSNGKYAFKVEGNPEIIKFTLEIFSGDYKYWSDSVTIDLVTDIDENNLELPSRFLLEQNYPNPFNPSTIIKYQIPSQVRNDNYSNLTSVRLVVYDVLGKEVATLINKKQKPGYYEALWNPINLSSGVYYYKLSTKNGFSQTKKLVLLK